MLVGVDCSGGAARDVVVDGRGLPKIIALRFADSGRLSNLIGYVNWEFSQEFASF